MEKAEYQVVRERSHRQVSCGCVLTICRAKLGNAELVVFQTICDGNSSRE